VPLRVHAGEARLRLTVKLNFSRGRLRSEQGGPRRGKGS